MNNCPKSTPWGFADHIEDIANGISWVSTPGHGGVWLSPERVARFRAYFPNWKGYTGGAQWLEEDCDWAAATVLFWDEFPVRHVFHGVEMVLNYKSDGVFYFGEIRNWLLSEKGESARLKAASYQQQSAA